MSTWRSVSQPGNPGAFLLLRNGEEVGTFSVLGQHPTERAHKVAQAMAEFDRTLARRRSTRRK